MVSLHILTFCIHETEVKLTVGMSLLGGLPEPAHGLGMVFLYTVPAHGLGMVSLRTLTFCIHETEVELIAGISLLGGLPVPRTVSEWSRFTS